MIPDRVLRAALWLSAGLNALGAVIFGQVAVSGMSPFVPVALPRFAAAQLAWVIAVFGVAYGWQAAVSPINRPLVALGGMGKLGFFVLLAVYWAAGEVPAAMAMNAVPDLLLGAVFMSWVWRRTP